MAKDYGRKGVAYRSKSALRQLLLVLLGFLSGYLSASFFDVAHLMTWVNTQLLANTAVKTVVKPIPQQAQLPKPKFEFYTLLANDHADTTQLKAAASVVAAVPSVITNTESIKNSQASGASVVVASAKEALQSSMVNKGAYLVQVASFKSRQEAERIRAALTLKGFVVNVTMVTAQHMNWYRVTIGPFASRIDAQKAQVSVARTEHITGMVRRMDA